MVDPKLGNAQELKMHSASELAVGRRMTVSTVIKSDSSIKLTKIFLSCLV